MKVLGLQPFLIFSSSPYFLCHRTFFNIYSSLKSSYITKWVSPNQLLKVNGDNKLIVFSMKPLTLSSSLLKKTFTKVQDKKSKRRPAAAITVEEEENENPELNSLLYKTGSSLWDISSVAVLQPWIKWGPQKRCETTPDILLDEACSLIRSLPFVKVSYKEYTTLQVISKTHIFGTGNLLRLKNEIRDSHSEAVFISIDHLTRVQKSILEEHFQVKVFDRFFIVLAIFKHHASTIEARLQIAMAELSFMSKGRLYENEKLMLDRKEAKLKEALKRLEMRRKTFRRARQKSSVPSVAVVGYTNCGKTTLIRALTGDKRAQGEDRLFATLDSTAHEGVLPCGLSVVFMDSVGFIQDIPTSLIVSFRTTLQDAIFSDVVVMVRDVSHPDIVGQTNTVKRTLRSLPLPKETPVIVINNKFDLLQEGTKLDDSVLQEGIFASSITGDGLKEVLANIELEVLRVTGRKMYLFRLLTGSPKFEWLKENAGVTSQEVDEKDPQYIIVRVVLSEAVIARFKKNFKL